MLIGTVREEIEERVYHSPAGDRWYDRRCETVVWPGYFPNDPNYRPTVPDKRFPGGARYPVVILPGRYRHDSEFPYPPRFIGKIGQTGRAPKLNRAVYFTGEYDGENHDVGLTTATLYDLQAFYDSLPYADVRRSTSGTGLHIRLLVTQPDGTLHPCHSRQEYNQLRRAAFQHIASLTGLPVMSADLSGYGVLWLWKHK